MGFFQDLFKGVSRALTPPKDSFLRPLVDTLAPFIPGYGQLYSALRYGSGLLSGEDAAGNLMGALGAFGGGGFNGMGKNLGSLGLGEALSKIGGPGFFQKMAPVLAGQIANQMSTKKTDFVQQMVKQQLGLQKMAIEQAKSASGSIDANDAKAVTSYSDALNKAVAPALANVENRIMRTTNGSRGIDTEAGVQKGAIASEAGKELGKFQAGLDATRDSRKASAISQAQAGVAGSMSGAIQADQNSLAQANADTEHWMKWLSEMFELTPDKSPSGGLDTSVSDDFKRKMQNLTLDYQAQTPGLKLPSVDWNKYQSRSLPTIKVSL